MADQGEPLGDYLDRLIYTLYGQVQRGIGYITKHPQHSDVIEYIEDEATGRPHPIEDAADHYLLRAFDMARREMGDSVPDGKGPRGHIYYTFGDDKKWSRLDADAVSGECPERCTHCQHLWRDHRDDDGGGPVTPETSFVYCGRCSCNSGFGR